MKKFSGILLFGFVFLSAQNITLLGHQDVNRRTNAAKEINFDIVGFATEEGGITGGQGGTIDTVSTGTELQEALKTKQDVNTPLTIIINGTITPENSPDLSKIDVKDVEDVSIIGSANGGEFDGIGIKIRRAGNIIIRNLKIHHVLTGEKDCIGIEGPADHIWIDHCEIYNEFEGVDKDHYDGLLDAKADCEYITYSWNYLHDSWKTGLVGSSESDTYDRKITMHHNYYSNCNSRIPLYRGGTGHVFNCYYVDIASTAINSRINACLKIENNSFENVNNPWVSAYSDVLGGGDVSGNLLVNSPFSYNDDTHELPECSLTLPYVYEPVLHDAEEVKDIVIQYAGVGKLTDPTDFKILDTSDTSSTEPPATTTLKKNTETIQTSIYPNPVKGTTTITFKLESASTVNISLYDMTGKQVEVIENSFYLAGEYKLQYVNERLANGMYILVIKSGWNSGYLKLIKE